ncbi:hypothetical protein AB0F72_28615 [Actinoplanes sp. NPDC023936]|uniref:hypothetical protein n=1 Tax=Actinoplanes sp. NPDC023936 TaxID=3154910 RepID=UPI0033EFF651
MQTAEVIGRLRAGFSIIEDNERFLDEHDIYPFPAGCAGQAIVQSAEDPFRWLVENGVGYSDDVRTKFMRSARRHHGVFFSSWFIGFFAPLAGVSEVTPALLAKCLASAGDHALGSSSRWHPRDFGPVAVAVAEAAAASAGVPGALPADVFNDAHQRSVAAVAEGADVDIGKRVGFCPFAEVVAFEMLLRGSTYGTAR